MATILLVEDDYALAMGTEYALQAEGYDVIHAANLAQARCAVGLEGAGQSGKEAALPEPMEHKMPDLVLLDVMLPDGNGYEFCIELRKVNQRIPIIFLTAVAEEVNIVQGLELGADGYVAKPYRVKELLSRIRANLRRIEMARAAALHQPETRDGAEHAHTYVQETGHQAVLKERANVQGAHRYCFGHHQLDVREYRLYANGTLVDITPGEFCLLKELAQNEGIVLTRTQLLEQLYDTGESFVDDNTLSVYMKRLRDKLGEDAIWIETVRGVGYRFRKRASE